MVMRRRVNSNVRPLREANPVGDSNVVIFVTKTGVGVLIEKRVSEFSKLSSEKLL